jgi:hypothetical protein
MSNGILDRLKSLSDEPKTQYAEEESVLLRMIKDALVEGAPNFRRESTNALRMSVKIIGNGIEIGGATPHPKGYVKYAAATNEAWKHPRWHGRMNPNEGWADRITMYYANLFALQYGYTLVVE